MRVNRSALYMVECVPGISGFKRWGETERWVVRGDRLRAGERREATPYRASSADMVRIDDGHLPEFRPLLEGPEAAERLRETGERGELL